MSTRAVSFRLLCNMTVPVASARAWLRLELKAGLALCCSTVSVHSLGRS
ncbi:MAG: hypothetical protein JWM21_1762 [Acidobacteria bacterium]|nr:hypothetical protein [Acidobacteriota bacterium]